MASTTTEQLRRQYATEFVDYLYTELIQAFQTDSENTTLPYIPIFQMYTDFVESLTEDTIPTARDILNDLNTRIDTTTDSEIFSALYSLVAHTFVSKNLKFPEQIPTL